MSVASTVLAVRPATIGSNPETRATNPFQRSISIPPEVVRAEFDGLVTTLREAGVRVIVANDTPDPPKPDAVFPNNWISFHGNAVVLYPLESPIRRAEVRPEIIDEVEAALGVRWPQRVDLSGAATGGRYLEGTGSLALDRALRRGLVGRSSRSHDDLVAAWGARFGYELTAFETKGPDGAPVYHTNVVVALGPSIGVWARPWIVAEDHAKLEDWFAATNRDSIPLSSDEAGAFAANALALENDRHEPLWVLSRGAERALRSVTKRRLEAHGSLVILDIASIETLGGGSARCTLAEVFLPGTAS